MFPHKGTGGYDPCEQINRRYIPRVKAQTGRFWWIGFVKQARVWISGFVDSCHVETVCALSKLSEAKHHISVKVDMDEMDVTAAESKATYQEIQDWVQEKYGFHVTNLNIAQVKQKHGIIARELQQTQVGGQQAAGMSGRKGQSN